MEGTPLYKAGNARLTFLGVKKAVIVPPTGVSPGPTSKRSLVGALSLSGLKLPSLSLTSFFYNDI